MPNFECDEVNLSFNFSLFLPEYEPTEPIFSHIFSHKHKLTVQVVRILSSRHHSERDVTLC